MIALVTSDPVFIPWHREQISRYGLAERVIGVTAIWVSALVAVRSARSADRSDAAHEDGPNREQHDRAREHDPVTQVG